MRAIRVHQHGGPEVVKIDELPIPKPSPGKVLVKIRATAMNHMDLWVRQGMPGVKIPLPIILGCEAAGVVEETGEEVVVNPSVSCQRCEACLSGNDHHCRAYGLFGETEDGTEIEYRLFPRENLLPKPKNLSFEEAAALPLTFLTAWHMLVDKGGLAAGQTVLVLAAASGVGSAGIQIAKLHGARVITTVSSEDKMERARALGADFVIDHKRQSIADEVKKITGGRSADIVMEHVGQATWEQSLKSLAFGGKIVTCGATTGPVVSINLLHLFIKQQQVIGSTMGPSHLLHKILRLAGEGRLKAVIDKAYKFDDVRAAHERLESRQQFGKIVLVP